MRLEVMPNALGDCRRGSLLAHGQRCRWLERAVRPIQAVSWERLKEDVDVTAAEKDEIERGARVVTTALRASARRAS